MPRRRVIDELTPLSRALLDSAIEQGLSYTQITRRLAGRLFPRCPSRASIAAYGKMLRAQTDRARIARDTRS